MFEIIKNSISEREVLMSQIAFIIFTVILCIFIGIMKYEPRTLWSGFFLLCTLMSLSISLLLLIYQYSDWFSSNDIIIAGLVTLLIITILIAIAFPGILVILFFVEGIRNIKYEGMKPTNLLSIIFSILLLGYLVIWPVINGLSKNKLGTLLYIFISSCVAYIFLLMTTYVISALLNLIHVKENRDADYIIVLGSGIIGKKVPPLLAARIERGLNLLKKNPKALLIMSGGQGAGEEIPESEAMYKYAISKGAYSKRIIMETRSVSTKENLLFSRQLIKRENPKIIIVTTAYHVFRALILAKQNGIRCVGFGAKTKWYFTLNALIREFVGFLSLSWRKHIFIMIGAASILSIISIIG